MNNEQISELELEIAFSAEMTALLDQNERAVLDMDAFQAMQLLGVVQLASRHPSVEASPSLATAIALVRAMQDAIFTTPALREIARRGWQAHYDRDIK